MANKNKNISSINVLQWNAQSIRPKLIELEQMLNQEKIHIAVISETWLDCESSLNISNYEVFRQDRDDGFGGVAILTHFSVKAERFQQHNTNPGIQTVCIKIHNCLSIQYVVSVYCPSTVRTDDRDWDSLFSMFKNKSLIAGDFNGHHRNWSTKSDSRGLQIFNTLIERKRFCNP